MTNEALIPVHEAVCQIEGVSDVELRETLTFTKNGLMWSVEYLLPNKPFVLKKNGTAIRGFTNPESIKTFFE